MLVAAQITVDFIANIAGSHRIAYRLVGGVSYTFVYTNVLAIGPWTSEPIDVVVDDASYFDTQWEGYVQANCMDIYSLAGRSSWTVTYPSVTFPLKNAEFFVGLTGGKFTVKNPGLIVDTGNVTADSESDPLNTSYTVGAFIVGPTVPQQTDVLDLYDKLKALAPTNIIDLTVASISGSNIGGGLGVFTPGVYASTGSVNETVGGTITLNGAGTYVFNIAADFTTGNPLTMLLTNGALASKVYFVIGTVIAVSTMQTKDNNILKGNFFLGNGGLGINIGYINDIEGRLLTTTTEDIVLNGNASILYLPIA